MDVWLSVSCIAIVLMLCAPVSKYAHATISVICLALLVAPVTSNPTGPLNIALAIGFAFAYLVMLWFFKRTTNSRNIAVRQQLFNSSTKLSTNTGNNNNININSIVYNALPNDEGIEMGTNNSTPTSSSLQPKQGAFVREETYTQVDDDQQLHLQNGGAAGWGVGTLGSSNWLTMRMLILPLSGLLFGLTGLILCALQSRTNYSILHSLWHISMMLSAYLMVRGKMEFGKQ
jgi:hypothetical protein